MSSPPLTNHYELRRAKSAEAVGWAGLPNWVLHRCNVVEGVRRPAPFAYTLRQAASEPVSEDNELRQGLEEVVAGLSVRVRVARRAWGSLPLRMH